MKHIGKKRVILFFLRTIAIVYIIFSLLYINQLSNDVSVEKKRVINIARHLKLWKSISINHNGYFDQESVLQENKGIMVAEIEHDKFKFDIKKDEKLYVMYYSNPASENKFQQYFSELVVLDFYYIITDFDGRIIEFSWDKP